MPSPTLPLDLQLDILDLAIPPPGFYHSLERALLCKRFSLVHRDWTARAQHHLAEYPTFEIGPLTKELHKRWERLEDTTNFGQRTNRLWLWTARDAEERRDASNDLALQVPDLQELSIRRSCTRSNGGRDYQLLVEDPNDLWYSDSLASARPYLDTLPVRLRFLSIAHLRLNDTNVRQITQLPNLDTLLLTSSSAKPCYFHFFQFPTCRFRVLGIKAKGFPFYRGYWFPILSPTIKHVALAGYTAPLYLEFAGRNFAVPTSLQSLEIFTVPISSDDDAAAVEAADSMITLACSSANASPKIVHFEEQQQMDEFDLEEWAAAIGHTSD